MEIRFISLLEAETLPPKDTTALISILDPEIHTKIPYTQWKHHIRLQFEDVNSEEDGVPFSEAMASRLIKFVLCLPETVDLLVIHCVAGISRSGAVTKFLTRYVYKNCYNVLFDKAYHTYNYRVYKTLAKVWKRDYFDGK